MTGLLTIDRWNARHARGENWAVFVNGEDVTNRCIASDDVRGWALLYALNAEGEKYVEWPPCGHRTRQHPCCLSFEPRVATELITDGIEHRMN